MKFKCYSIYDFCVYVNGENKVVRARHKLNPDVVLYPHRRVHDGSFELAYGWYTVSEFRRKIHEGSGAFLEDGVYEV